jgi:hypothetical protein
MYNLHIEVRKIRERKKRSGVANRLSHSTSTLVYFFAPGFLYFDVLYKLVFSYCGLVCYLLLFFCAPAFFYPEGIILRGRWFHIIVINVHAPTEDKTDDVKDGFYEELERIFDKFPK